MLPYPRAVDLLKLPAGSPLLEIRRSPRSMLSHAAWFVVSLVVVYGLTAAFKDQGLFSSISFLPTISVRWLALVPAAILLETCRQLYDDLYIFLDERILHQDGKLSLKYIVPAVRYSDIRAITVYQDVLGRLLDYGDIDVGTAAQDGAEISFYGIRSPKELARLLDELRNYHRSRDGKAVREDPVALALASQE